MKQFKQYLFIIITLLLWSSVSNAFQLITVDVDDIDRSVKWGENTTMGTSGGVVNWSYDTTELGSLFNGLDYIPELNNAFTTWSNIADITFVNVADASLNGIHIQANNIDGPGRVIANALTRAIGFSSSNAWNIDSSLITFDTSENWNIGFDGIEDTFDIFQVLTHEIGHAIGIDHESLPITAVMNPIYDETGIRGLQADDIAAAQFIYGASAVPIPAAFWLFATGLGLLISRSKYKTFQ